MPPSSADAAHSPPRSLDERTDVPSAKSADDVRDAGVSTFIRIAMGVNRIFCRGFHRLRVCSPHHFPRKGPAILVCNHLNGIDPLMLQAVSPRQIIWMMAREYYEIPGLRSSLERAECIPVDRNGRDMKATRAALRALEQGRILGIFPEGKIELTRELLPFQVGVGLLALKANVPILPAYIDGTQRGVEQMLKVFLIPQESAIRFGPPLQLQTQATDGRAAVASATQQIEAAVRSLALDFRACG